MNTQQQELINQYKYHHLTARTDKRYILLWVSNTHPEFEPTENGDGTDTIQGWKPLLKWQCDLTMAESQFQQIFRDMASIAQTGHLPQ